MLYSHIYKASAKTGFKFELVITDDPSPINENVIQSYFFNNKVEAKKQAKQLNATAWNY